MRNIRFDWRWVILILGVAVLANSRTLPWPVVVLVLGGCGGYLVYLGLQALGGGRSPIGGGPRVTYWRGQRIEIAKPQSRPARLRMPPLHTLGPALFYFIIGGALVLAALAVALGRA